MLLRNCSLSVIVFLSSFYEIDPAYEVPLSPFAVIESTIRSKYDSYAVFKWDQYTELLAKLSQDKFIVLPLYEMRNTFMVRSPGIKYLFKEIYSTGAEIGIHNDLLTLLILNNIDPFLFNKEELKFYKSLKVPIYGTAAYGSPLAKETVPNYEVFSDFAKSDSVLYLGKNIHWADIA